MVKENLQRVFIEFHYNKVINQSTNANFIVLVSKRIYTNKILDFKPMSLITNLYRIIVKVLLGHIQGIF